MAEILRTPDGHYQYQFSGDILMLVRQNAHAVSESTQLGLIFHLNLSSVFVAGSYLEAKLNEETANCARSSSPNIKPSAQFWVTLEAMKKDLSAVEKWNLIAATRGGQQWNPAIEPFQSYETLVTCSRPPNTVK